MILVSKQVTKPRLEMFDFSEFFSVAFHATVRAKFPTVGDNDIVKFDHVYLNTGNR